MTLTSGKRYHIKTFDGIEVVCSFYLIGASSYFELGSLGRLEISDVHVIREVDPGSKLEIDKTSKSPWDSQVGGSHYTDKAIQPLQRTLLNKGYEAFSGACYTKIDKYTTRVKDNEVEQLKKAKHVLELWIYEAEQQANK